KNRTQQIAGIILGFHNRVALQQVERAVEQDFYANPLAQQKADICRTEFYDRRIEECESPPDEAGRRAVRRRRLPSERLVESASRSDNRGCRFPPPRTQAPHILVL